MLLAYKLGMMSLIDKEGCLKAITLLRVPSNFVTQVKTPAKDGYKALQIGADYSSRIKKPQIGHAKNAGLKQGLRFSREWRLKKDENLDFKSGQEMKVSFFKTGDLVEVVGTSKGKGFAGTIKRHNFTRMPKTHGGKGEIRTPGSIGSVYPQRVNKGKKMSGRMGGKRVTTTGLKIGLVDEEKNLLGVFGALPGPRKGLLIVRKVGS